MTRKDYELIAEAIRRAHGFSWNFDEDNGIAMVARSIAESLADANSQFDRVRFLNACFPMGGE